MYRWSLKLAAMYALMIALVACSSGESTPDAGGWDGYDGSVGRGDDGHVGPELNPTEDDTDGDGLLDGQELIAGTDPNLASDAPRITSIRMPVPGQLVLSWPVREGRLYSLEYWDGDLFPGVSFLPMPEFTDLPAPADGIMTVTNQLPSPTTHRFYRLKVMLEAPQDLP